MQIYNEQLIHKKIDNIFKDLKKQCFEIIDIHSDKSVASKMIVDAVSSETSVRSKTLFTDMSAKISEKRLSSSIFEDPERRSRFYEANIRGEVLKKYKFRIKNIDTFQYKELNRLYSSISVSAGTTSLGVILKYAFKTNVNIPILVIISSTVPVFFISYFTVLPKMNEKFFRKAVEDFLSESKKEFILWFDEIERYYNQEIDNLVDSFWIGGLIWVI